MWGVRLLLLHPELSDRPCDQCRRFWYDDRGDQFGKLVMRAGKPTPRPASSKPPCGLCPKIPPGDPPRPESAQELSDKNAAAYEHYLACKAVGRFPDDPIVRHCAGMIRQIEDAAGRASQARIQLNMLSALTRR